jgi:hypothetical protein
MHQILVFYRVLFISYIEIFGWDGGGAESVGGSVVKPHENRQLERPKKRWEENPLS